LTLHPGHIFPFSSFILSVLFCKFVSVSHGTEPLSDWCSAIYAHFKLSYARSVTACTIVHMRIYAFDDFFQLMMFSSLLDYWCMDQFTFIFLRCLVFFSYEVTVYNGEFWDTHIQNQNRCFLYCFNYCCLDSFGSVTNLVVIVIQ